MALKFMNNYFYGKAGKKDFTESDLPANRFRLFGDVLKVRWGSMVSLNLLYMLIWLPAAAWTILNIGVIFTQAASEEAADLSVYLTTYLLVLFPLIAITGPFNIGASYVARNWARDEHAFVWGDFKDAMKRNWKQALLYSLIEGAVPLVLAVTLRFYLTMSAQSFVFFLPAGLLILLGVVWKLAAMLMPTMILTYDLKFRGIVRNAVIMSLAALPRAVAIKLATLVIPLLAFLLFRFVPSSLTTIFPIASCLYGLFLLAFNKLLIGSYANYACEKYLNPKIEGARTNIGLRPDIK